MFSNATKEQSKDNPLELHGVDLRFQENTKFHQTATKVMKDANIVLKRGMPFFFDLLLHREFENDTDVVKIEFDWGKNLTRSRNDLYHVIEHGTDHGL